MQKAPIFILLLLFALPLQMLAQYGGGNGKGEFFTVITTSPLDGTTVAMYAGGNGRGETNRILNTSQLDSTKLSLYGGGNGRGEILNMINANQLDGLMSGLYGGGNGRGEILMAINTNQLDGVTPSLYGGGNGRGEIFASKNNSQLDSNIINIYGGGNGRGEILSTINTLQLDGLQASLYLGGNGRGEIVSQVNNTPLPIKIVSFGATLVGKEVSLQWQTATEINSASFVVEKSLDTRGWQAIGTVKAAGNSSTPLSYQLYDKNPVEGINYYRLKLLDIDNRMSYSGIASVRYHMGAASQISVYPNPAKYQFTVAISGVQNNPGLNLRLVNTNGQTVLEKQHATGNIFTFDITKLPAGTYYLLTIIDGKTTTAKVVKE